MTDDAPDWQHVVTLVAGVTTDAPDWETVVTGPGGGSLGGITYLAGQATFSTLVINAGNVQAWLTTASLAVGTWLLVYTVTVESSSAGDTFDLTVNPNTATVTFGDLPGGLSLGQTFAVRQFVASEYQTVTGMCLVPVTGAGSMDLKVDTGVGNVTVHNQDVGAGLDISGYVALKVA